MSFSTKLKKNLLNLHFYLKNCTLFRKEMKVTLTRMKGSYKSVHLCIAKVYNDT